MNSRIVTVFYVDDNDRSRRLLSTILAEHGFEMITAADPAEALRRCGKISFDLALLDYETSDQIEAAWQLEWLIRDCQFGLDRRAVTLPAQTICSAQIRF